MAVQYQYHDLTKLLQDLANEVANQPAQLAEVERAQTAWDQQDTKTAYSHLELLRRYSFAKLSPFAQDLLEILLADMAERLKISGELDVNIFAGGATAGAIALLMVLVLIWMYGRN